MANAAYTDTVQKVYIAYYGRAADPVGLSYWEDQLAANNGDLSAIMNSFGTSAEANTLFGSLSDTAKVNKLYNQLFGRDADYDGLMFYAGKLADGSMTAATIAQNILDGAQNADLTIINNKLAVAKNFTTAIDTADELVAYAGDTAAGSARTMLATVNASTDTSAFDVATTVASIVTAANATSADANQTFTLTTSIDSMTGGSGADTFNAGNAAGNAANQTFSTGDTLDGGAGADVLNATIGTTSTYAANAVSGIETVNGLFTAAGTMSLLGATGIENISSNGSTAAATFTNIASTDVGLKVASSDQDATFTFASSAVSGSADTATLTLSGQTSGTDTIAGVETLNIVSSDSANTLTALTAAAATTLNISGDQNLNLGTDNTVATTIDGSAATGNLTIGSNNSSAVTITGGAGADTITMTGGTAGADTVSLGAGNDTVIFTADFANTDTITGGAGTDELRVDDGEATSYTTPSTRKISGFENLQITGELAASLTVADIQEGIEKVILNDGMATGQTLTLDAGSRTVELEAATGGSGETITFADTGTATTDSLTIENGAAATDVFDDSDVVVTGFENVTINNSGTGAATTQDIDDLTITADTGGSTTLTVTGSNAMTFETITAGTIDFSGVSAASSGTTINMANAAASVTTITGSEGNDTLKGDASSTINGGGGIDTITGGSGNDVINGGAGNDIITSAAGKDTINGGDGDDTLTLAGNFATGDVIDGGAGTDTLSLTNASVAVIDGYSMSVATALNDNLSNVERVKISDAFNTSVSLDMARLDSINYINLDAAFTGDETISGLASNSTVVIGDAPNTAADILTLTLADATGSADVLNITLDNNTTADYGVVSVSGIETINIVASEATASSTVDTMTLDTTISSGSTVNISGTENFTSGAAIAATTIDASGLSAGKFTMNSSASGLSQTITGSATGADTIYGGGGADTIVTAAGADTIYGGTGADTITSGNGGDTIYGGSGSDVITLTETTAATDVVILDYSEAGTYVDSVTGFTAGSTSGDRIDLDLSALETAGTSGIHSSAADFVLLGAGTTSIGAATSMVLQEVTSGGATASATATVFAIQGTTIADVSDLEDALESGGSMVLTTDGNVDANDAFIVLYSDGTDSYLASVRATTADNGSSQFDTGTLDANNLIKIVGDTSIAASEYVAGNFDFIA